MSVFQELNATFAKVEQALKAVVDAPKENDRERGRLEAGLCLSTREAYSDFHSLSLVHETIDPEAKQKLASLFKQAIPIFLDPEFSSAVSERSKDFQEFCAMMESSPDLLEVVLGTSASEGENLEMQ